MLRRLNVVWTVIALILLMVSCSAQEEDRTDIRDLKLAVEYNTHAACAFVAQQKGWISGSDAKNGSFDFYITGVALAGALTKGEVDAAYICLVPAITAYANGKVPLKIVCGTHKYGYALVVNADRIKTVKDLEKNGIKIGCVREGGATDVFLHKILEYYSLEKDKVLPNVQRMDPAKQVMALKAQKLDAILVPEHFATLASERLDFKLLIRAQDVWPQMQGSVLVVTDKLLRDNPRAVSQLEEITSRATRYINENKKEAAASVAERLNLFLGMTELKDRSGDLALFQVDSTMIYRSFSNASYDTSVEEAEVQKVIDMLYRLGYIKESFAAKEILVR